MQRFGATVCKTVRSPYAIGPLSVLSVLSVCDVGVYTVAKRLHGSR